MDKQLWNSDYLGVLVDMAGCPNRCRHCWLGSHRNGNITIEEFITIADGFKSWRDEAGTGIKELGFFTWWREPDFRDDYRELWALEQELSSPGRAQRFELLSTWRLARDESYAKWAATLEPKACQITFFGMEENTDWFMRRKGAFQDQLTSTLRLLDAGIAPRWQLFPTKRSIDELDDFTRLIYELKLHRRCEEIGQRFEVFIGGMSPEGNGYELEDIRLEEDDMRKIPNELISISRDGLDMLGKEESYWYEILINELKSPNFHAIIPCIEINADFDAYPNIAEPASWWRLGNLKSDGIDGIIKAYRDETPPGMQANRNTTISELTKRFGITESKKLYTPGDLITRFMHQWGTSAYT